MFGRVHRRSLQALRSVASYRPSAPKPPINAVQEARLAGMPLDILCYLGDREEMAHSLEARLPFLDHELYDAAKFIPVDLKIRGGVEKAVLRDAANGILPDDIRLRPKRGFMQTSDAVDFFGVDRECTQQLRSEHLSRDAFVAGGAFSYRTYVLLSLVARVPAVLPSLRRLRRDANKVIMYMMQIHMLHRLFVAEPRWRQRTAESEISAQMEELVC
jgi:asparagine synthase (glutamine-hydrolysing)